MIDSKELINLLIKKYCKNKKCENCCMFNINNKYNICELATILKIIGKLKE